jgi:hypothetical protein
MAAAQGSRSRHGRSSLTSVCPGVVAVVTQVAHILLAVATVATPIPKVPAQVTLILTTVAEVLATFLARVVVPDLTRVLPKLATVLPNFIIVAAKLPGVAMDVAPVGTQLVRLVACHSRMRASVWMIGVLRVHNVGTAYEQGRGDGGHSDIAHCISQRRYPALAAMACAARTTVALW